MSYCKNCGKEIFEAQLGGSYGLCLACFPKPSPRSLLEKYYYEKTGEKIDLSGIPIKKISANDYEKQFFKGRSHELIKFYRERLTNNHQEKELWVRLCFVLYMMGYFKEVRKAAIEALEIFENDVILMGYLREAHKRTGEKEKGYMITQIYNLPKFAFNITDKDIKKDLKKVKKWKNY